MTKIVLLQNTMISRERHVAGEVVELEDSVAKKYCTALLAAPYAEIENGELVTDADVEVVEAFAEQVEESEELQQEIAVEQAEEVAEEIAEPKQEVEQPAANKGTKKGKK